MLSATLLVALVQEMQRSLFLLSGMARLLGQWQLALPGSLPAARSAAASFLAHIAQARPGERFTYHCAPVSPSEKASIHSAVTQSPPQMQPSVADYSS